jgi:predicted PurR-regulated permease PerM
MKSNDSDPLGSTPPASGQLPSRIAGMQVGLWLAVFLALLGWTTLHSLGPLAIALGVWLLAGALPGARERHTARSLIVLFGTLWIVHTARWVVYPLLAGMLIALLVAPVVAWLEAKRVRRPLAAILVLLPFGLLVGALIAILVPLVTRQGQLLLEKLPAAYAFVTGHLQPLARFLGEGSREAAAPPTALVDSLRLSFPGAGGDSSAAFPAAAGPTGVDWLKQATSHGEALLRAAFGGISGVGRGLGRLAQYVALAFLTPVVAYHLLADRAQFRDLALRWLPDRWHDQTLRTVRDIGASLQVYLRGQFLVAAVEAILFSVVFAVARLPQPVALGVLAGLLSLVPVLGFWLTVVLVVLNAVTGPGAGAALLKAGIGIALVNTFEGQVLVPRIQGSGLGLHPLAVLLGVLFFGTLFGMVGVLLAVPAMGVLRATLPRIEEAWRRNSTYRGHDPQTGAPPFGD